LIEYIQKIYIDQKVRDRPITRMVLENWSGEVLFIDQVEELLQEWRKEPNTITASKRRLLIRDHKGEMLKPCPCTPKHICCNYYVFNFMTNCPLDCSYCIMQTYLNQPAIILYANADELLKHAGVFFKAHPKRFFRVGTGELTDSLALDGLTHFSSIIIPFFARQSNAMLELKTKTTCVDNLLNINAHDKIVVSWSINPQKIIDSDEPGTATLTERLESAKACQEAGYHIGFHFDPLIYYQTWEDDYKEVVDMIFSYVGSDNILWISLGALRFNPSLKPVIESRFPQSLLPFGELIPGMDNKLRYVKSIRLDLFQKMIRYIREHSPHISIYLCMESPQVWARSKITLDSRISSSGY